VTWQSARCDLDLGPIANRFRASHAPLPWPCASAEDYGKLRRNSIGYLDIEEPIR